MNLERAVSRLEQKIATSAMEEKQILDRLWEHYELSHADAAAQRAQDELAQRAGVARDGAHRSTPCGADGRVRGVAGSR